MAGRRTIVRRMEDCNTQDGSLMDRNPIDENPMDESLRTEVWWTKVQQTKVRGWKSATHRHRQRPWCYKVPVSSAAMVDGNATLQLMWLQLVWLQARDGAVALLWWRVEPTATLLCSDARRRFQNFCFFVFYSAVLTASSTRKREREKESGKLLYTQEKKKKRKREKELWNLFGLAFLPASLLLVLLES